MTWFGEVAERRRPRPLRLCALFPVLLPALCSVSFTARAQAVDPTLISLPDAPSAILAASSFSLSQTPVPKPSVQSDVDANQSASATLPPCPMSGLTGHILFLPGHSHGPCQEEGQLEAIVDSGHVRPLKPAQKGLLAVRGIVDPFNLITIAGFSAISVATNAHSVYGPGLKGFGRLAGYSLVGDIQGELLGTYLIPVVTHEDPRYHRMPGRPLGRRILHVIVHTYVTQHDDGSLMPNYSVLVGYPVGNLLSNTYVPGIDTSPASTTRRIAYGIATNPVGDTIAEFLPDVARRIHIRVIFVQQILNKVAQGTPTQ